MNNQLAQGWGYVVFGVISLIACAIAAMAGSAWLAATAAIMSGACVFGYMIDVDPSTDEEDWLK